MSRLNKKTSLLALESVVAETHGAAFIRYSYFQIYFQFVRKRSKVI